MKTPPTAQNRSFGCSQPCACGRYTGEFHEGGTVTAKTQMFDIGEHDIFHELGAVRATPYGSDVVFSNSERKVPIHIGAGTSPAFAFRG